MSEQPRWDPPVPPGPPVAPPPAPEKPDFRRPETAQAPPPALPLAGWWARVGAYLIDTLLMLAIATVVFFLVWAISGDAGTAGIGAAIAWGAAEYLFRGLVYAPALMARSGPHNGQTLGKQAVGIRVVRDDAQPMDYGRAAVREWVVITLLIGIVGGTFTGGIAPLIDYLWPLWEERNRAGHDIIASTMVFSATLAESSES
jgi:uncharacterized RDD family membrane protein YckC